MKNTKVISNNCEKLKKENEVLKNRVVRLEAERDFLLTRRDEEFEKVEDAAEYWQNKFEQLNKLTNNKSNE